MFVSLLLGEHVYVSPLNIHLGVGLLSHKICVPVRDDQGNRTKETHRDSCKRFIIGIHSCGYRGREVLELFHIFVDIHAGGQPGLPVFL